MNASEYSNSHFYEQKISKLTDLLNEQKRKTPKGLELKVIMCHWFHFGLNLERLEQEKTWSRQKLTRRTMKPLLTAGKIFCK